MQHYDNSMNTKQRIIQSLKAYIQWEKSKLPLQHIEAKRKRPALLNKERRKRRIKQAEEVLDEVSGTSVISDFPLEIVFAILVHTDAKGLQSFMSVNRQFRATLTEPFALYTIIKRKFVELYGSSPNNASDISEDMHNMDRDFLFQKLHEWEMITQRDDYFKKMFALRKIEQDDLIILKMIDAVYGLDSLRTFYEDEEDFKQGIMKKAFDAASKKSLKYLETKGFELKGFSVEYAVSKGNTEGLRYLYENGHSHMFEGDDVVDPEIISEAILKGYFESVKYLIDKIQMDYGYFYDLNDAGSVNFIIDTIELNNLEATKFYVEIGSARVNWNNYHSIFVAVVSGTIEIADYLVRKASSRNLYLKWRKVKPKGLHKMVEFVNENYGSGQISSDNHPYRPIIMNDYAEGLVYLVHDTDIELEDEISSMFNEAVHSNAFRSFEALIKYFGILNLIRKYKSLFKTINSIGMYKLFINKNIINEDWHIKKIKQLCTEQNNKDLLEFILGIENKSSVSDYENIVRDAYHNDFIDEILILVKSDKVDPTFDNNIILDYANETAHVPLLKYLSLLESVRNTVQNKELLWIE